MNRNNPQSLALRARDTARSFSDLVKGTAGKVGAAVTGTLASFGAFAQATGLGSSAATEIGSAEAEVSAVQLAIVGILVLMLIAAFVYKSMRR